MKFSRGYVRSALAALAAAAAAGCTDPEREAAYGKESFEAGDWKGAVEHYSKCLEASPGEIDGKIMLARAHLNLGELREAEAALASLPPENASDTDVLLVGAKIDFYAKRHEAAREKFLRVAKDKSLDAKTRSEGWAGAGAVDCFAECVSPGADPVLRDRSRVELLAALRLDRRNPAAYYHLGQLYRDSFGYVDAALQQLRYFIHLDKSGGKRVQDVAMKAIPALKNERAAKSAARPGAGNRNPREAMALLSKADALYGKKNYDAASKLYAGALAKDPLSYAAAVGLARSRERSGNPKDAVRAYKIAAELDPEAVDAMLAAARLSSRLGYWATATSYYSLALAARDNNRDAVAGLIAAHEKSGNPKAAEIYRGYLEFLPPAR